MDALELLKEDHQRVSALFDQIAQATLQVDRRRIFEQIRLELETHTYIEETVFYPAFQAKSEFQDLIEEALVEHQEVKDLLQEIEDLDDGKDSEEFEDKIDELIDAVEQHVDEEENDLFPRIEAELDAQSLEELRVRLEEAEHDVSEAA